MNLVRGRKNDEMGIPNSRERLQLKNIIQLRLFKSFKSQNITVYNM